jgi:hypothetical protein
LIAALLVLLPLAVQAQEASVTTWIVEGEAWVFIGILVMGGLAAVGIFYAKAGHTISARAMPAVEAAEDGIGRAVEMGRPVVFVPGVQGITKAGTIAGLSILRLVAEKCAEVGARLIVPCRDTIVTSIARETVEDAYKQAGRHEEYRSEDVFFISRRQLAYTAGVNGVLEREHPATVFLQGEFSAESLIFGETGNRAGAMLIAGTDKETQLPFFITTCDHTLIGEELYAAGAAISKDVLTLGSLRGVDLARLVVGAIIVLGIVLEIARLGWIRTMLGG